MLYNSSSFLRIRGIGCNWLEIHKIRGNPEMLFGIEYRKWNCITSGIGEISLGNEIFEGRILNGIIIGIIIKIDYQIIEWIDSKIEE